MLSREELDLQRRRLEALVDDKIQEFSDKMQEFAEETERIQRQKEFDRLKELPEKVKKANPTNTKLAELGLSKKRKEL